jgi:hypothetical protein
MKEITGRDLEVIKCVLAWKPNATEITIKKWVVADPTEPEYKIAIVSIPSDSEEIRVKVKGDSGLWVALSMSTSEWGGLEFDVWGGLGKVTLHNARGL